MLSGVYFENMQVSLVSVENSHELLRVHYENCFLKYHRVFKLIHSKLLINKLSKLVIAVNLLINTVKIL